MSFHTTFCWGNSYLDIRGWGRLLHIDGHDQLLATAVAPNPVVIDCKVDAVENAENHHSTRADTARCVVVHYVSGG